jgi:hypothetical protein
MADLSNDLFQSEVESIDRVLTRLMQRFDEFAHGWAGFG